MKPAPVHLDKLGREIEVGDAVCYPVLNSLEVGTVKKLHAKMITVWEAGQTHYSWYSGSKKYPKDLVKVEGPEVTMYLLKLK